MRRFGVRTAATVLLAFSLVTGLLTGTAGAAPPPLSPEVDIAAAQPVATAPDAVPEPERVAVLGAGWETSTDRAWTTSW